MIKNICSIIFALSILHHSVSANAGGNVKVAWVPPIQSVSLNKDVLSFTGAVYETPFELLPTLVLNFEGKSIQEFTITVASYLPLTPAELLLIPKDFTADSIIIQKREGIKNRVSVTLISFVPIRFNSSMNRYEKLIDFSYSYTAKAIERPKSNARIAAVSSSVLASGNWYKLEISSTPTTTGSGIYKIDYELLKSMIGGDIDNIDAHKIQLYGNGGGMLPESNAAFKYDDLQENAIKVIGEDDGKFNQGDYILFYAQGPDAWRYDTSKNLYKHVKNIYSNSSYYFLKIGETAGKRVSIRIDTGSVVQSINQYPEHLFYEKDDYNLLTSGRSWYGDKFESSKKDFTPISVDGINASSGITFSTAVMAQSLSTSSFDVTLNGTKYNMIIGASSADYGAKGVEVSRDIKIAGLLPGSGNSLGLTYTYNKSTNSSVGYLNYYEVNFNKDLVFSGNNIQFRSKQFPGLTAFTIGNFTENSTIWDVSNPIAPDILNYTLADGNATFTSNTDNSKEFVAFQGADFLKPRVVGAVKNQDLHALANSSIPDLIIVTSPEFLSAANTLAQYRNSHDKLETIVATTSDIYNEFSSGAQDLVAIRNFVKMFYDKNTSSDSVSYLLLFGAGSYDYKDRIKSNTNFVPVYETPESLNDISSQSSDDYCGFLDNNEGEWDNPKVVHYMDIGIGRLGVRNLEEAQKVVAKLIHYSSAPESQGKWRNKVCLVSDNRDPSFIHLNDAEQLASTIVQNNPASNINKLYMDAFPLVSAPGGQTCPTIKDALLKEINKGTLIVNYSGHGSEYLWAQEDILNIGDINKLTNKNNLPFFITATCEFGRYDDPARFSGASSLTLNPDGGAIGILTSTRPVYAYSNVTINKAFYNEVFEFSGNTRQRLGEIMRNTKNNSIIGYNNRNYALLGDPSMMLAYPEKEIVVTSINDSAVSNILDTLNALNKVTLSGEVRENGQVISTYNGKVNISIYDKATTVVTESSSFKIQNNMIFDGVATVENGKFSLNFVVSKDISYNFGSGKISMYSDDSIAIDAGGYFANIVIGGSAINATKDTVPPSIKLYIGDESFVSGGIAGSNTRVIAHLTDSSGINISNASIGHEIIGILNASKDVIVMNDFYTSEKDNYKNGVLSYPLTNLTPGNYTIQIKAWDTYNNSNIQSIDFVVPANDALVLNRVMNYPNPFSQATTISFEHNRSGEDIEASVLIYSITGDLVKSFESKILASPSRVTELKWDGRDELGSLVNNGLYICKLKITVPKDASQVTRHVKLMLLN